MRDLGGLGVHLLATSLDLGGGGLELEVGGFQTLLTRLQLQTNLV